MNKKGYYSSMDYTIPISMVIAIIIMFFGGFFDSARGLCNDSVETHFVTSIDSYSVSSGFLSTDYACVITSDGKQITLGGSVCEGLKTGDLIEELTEHCPKRDSTLWKKEQGGE